MNCLYEISKANVNLIHIQNSNVKSFLHRKTTETTATECSRLITQLTVH